MATPVFWSAVLVVFVVTQAFPGARSGAVSQAPETPPAMVWEATGFTAPESVVFDSGRRQFYVSNWAHGARARHPMTASSAVSGRTAASSFCAG